MFKHFYAVKSLPHDDYINTTTAINLNKKTWASSFL